MAKIAVLVVDDSPFIHKALSRALNSEEFEIRAFAKNGKEGVEHYFTHSPDVVIMDITMPVMDGLESSQAILSRDLKAKIIMLSAMGDEELIDKAKAIGISIFLQKPFKNEELTSAVKTLYEGMNENA